MSHVTARGFSRGISVACFIVAFLFLIFAVATLNFFPVMVLFLILAAVSVRSGFYFGKQQAAGYGKGK